MVSSLIYIEIILFDVCFPVHKQRYWGWDNCILKLEGAGFFPFCLNSLEQKSYKSASQLDCFCAIMRHLEQSTNILRQLHEGCSWLL